MCEKTPTKFSPNFWHLSVLMRFSAIFCIICVVNVGSVKNLPRSYPPGEENKHVEGRNNEDEYTPKRQVSNENLLYSTDNEIKLFNFTANETFVIRKNVKCLGLAAAGDYFYYGTSDDYKGYVHRTSMTTGKTDLIIDTMCNDSIRIHSIDIDWITGNIYFSTDFCIGVCSREEEFCSRVKSFPESDLCHIGLAPRSGLLFTSMSGTYRNPHVNKSYITKASMDGTNETDLYWDAAHPISLTVDELSEMVFWMDVGQGGIHCIQFDGKNWKIIFPNTYVHFFTVSKFQHNFFWTEENKNTIGMNIDNETKFIVDENATSIEYLYVFSPVLQHHKILNPCTNSGCNGLCLLRPSSDKGFLNFTCLCDNNTTSSSRKQWCNNPFIPLPHGWDSQEDYGDESQPSQTEGGFEKDFKADIRPSQPEGRIEKHSEEDIQPPQTEERFKWLNVISLVIICSFLILLAGVSIYFMFRRRSLYRSNADSQIISYVHLTECENASL
ncbi:vitellogenin receptor-like [Planococcus citri]|uniref:vitellogenin receptor-like n=1 Tax=Planococcus citri TaxID=170843 RepID=UPI0031F896D2